MQNIRWLFIILTSALIWQAVCDRQAAHAADASNGERLSQMMDEASAFYRNAEYVESYDVYRAILEIDPDHQEAIERVFELAVIFKRSGELWRQQGDIEEADKNDRLYRQVVKELMELLTGRWQTTLQDYNRLSDAEKRRKQSPAIPTLRRLISIIDHVHAIYERFYDNDETSRATRNKLRRAIETYQEELRQYERETR